VSRMVFRQRKRKAVDLNLNVTSLIDVLFLLLIFFMLTSTFKRAGELELNLPESSTARPAGVGSATQGVDLVLTEKGTLMLDGAPVTFETLPAGLRAVRERRPGAQIMIEAETSVAHGQVVRLLDAVRTAGFQGVGIGATTTKAAGAKTGR
jgi:biopolymer transport protein ExbD